MLCKTCSTWGRTEADRLEEHHKDCPERAEALRSHLLALLAAMDAWAVQEDGIPEEAWDAYAAACEAVGKAVPLTSRPWFDPT